MYQTWLKWFENLIVGFSKASDWLITPFQLGDLTVSPLGLISFSGLTAFIVIALVKWIAS